MRYHEIVEDAKSDLAQKSEAERIAYTFMKWLHENASDVPLKDAPGGHERAFGPDTRAWAINGVDIGLPDNDDLFFGFSWKTNGGKEGSRAALTRGWSNETGRAIYYVTFTEAGSPMDKQDIAFSCRWNDMIHEVIHYLDYRRGLQKTSRFNRKRQKKIASRKSTTEYYNDLLELNAYFQAGMSDIFASVVRRARYPSRPDREDSGEHLFKDYGTFAKYALSNFRGEWLVSLSPENKKRLNKRLYKIYSYLAPTWPNTEEVAAAVAKLKADEAAQEARWAAEDAALYGN